MQYFAKVAFVPKKITERLAPAKKSCEIRCSKSAKKAPKRLLTPLAVSYTEEKENYEEDDNSIFSAPFSAPHTENPR